MPCCAFAVFLVSQIVWPVRKLLSFMPFGGRLAMAGAPDAGSAWRPGETASVSKTTPTSFFSRRGLVLALALELTLAGGAAATASAFSGIPFSPASSSQASSSSAPSSTAAELFARFDALHAPLCRSLGLRAAEASSK